MHFDTPPHAVHTHICTILYLVRVHLLLKGFMCVFLYSDILGNIITYTCLYIYGRVGSQCKLLLYPKGCCTMHILLNYLTVFDNFWMMEQCYLQGFPWFKNHQKWLGISGVYAFCSTIYCLKKVTTGIQPSGTWSFLEFYDFKCSLLLQVMGF